MPRPGITYDYSDGETLFEAYITGADERRRPTILLAHEWSGLNTAMRLVAERIADLGYVCFAMDVYGKGLSAASEHSSVDPDRVVALGYCFGGLCALDMARANPPNLSGVVSVHGGLKPPGTGPQGRIDLSVLVLQGWSDPMAPAQDVLTFAGEMTDAGADWQIHVYGHAMHAFTAKHLNEPERGLAYDERADVRSWASMREFFAATIGGPAS